MTKPPEIGRPTKQNSSTNNEIAIKFRARKGTCAHRRPINAREGRLRAHALKRKKGPRGDRIPPRALPASAAARAHRKAPSASATPCPPAAWRCSTLGEGGLNCRVRDGTGSIPASVVALAGGAPPRLMYSSLPGSPSGATLAAVQRRKLLAYRRLAKSLTRMRRARAISSARLSGSPRLHLRPVDRVFYPGPYRKVDSSRRRLPA